MAEIVLSKPQESTFPSGQTTTMTKETEEEGGQRLGDGENEAIRKEREREKEDFIYHVPENQKSVQPQSWEKQGLCRTREWRECDFIESNFVHLLILFILFLHQLSLRGNRVYTCGRLTVACKDVREWGWRYGCVGSTGCSVPSEESPALRIVELMHRRDLHSFSNPCWRHWLLSHADSSKTGSKKTRFGLFFFSFFPSVCLFFGVTADVVYDVCTWFWMCFCLSSATRRAVNTLTKCCCSTILSLHPFQRRMAGWTKPWINPEWIGAYKRCIIPIISSYPAWLSQSYFLHPELIILPDQRRILAFIWV